MDSRVIRIDERESDFILYNQDNLPLTVSREDLWKFCYEAYMKKMPFDALTNVTDSN